MRDRLASIGLLKTTFDLREKVETFHGVFHRRVFSQVLNNSDDLTLYLRCFHGAINSQRACIFSRTHPRISSASAIPLASAILLTASASSDSRFRGITVAGSKTGSVTSSNSSSKSVRSCVSQKWASS